MIVTRDRCGLCHAPFTAYGSEGCFVVRINPPTRRLACRFRDHTQAALVCPALRQTTNIIPKVTTVPAPISGQDYRVYAVLTQEFATSTDIAVRAKLPTRARAERAATICGKLVRLGLAECAQSGPRTLWRLRAPWPPQPAESYAISSLDRDNLLSGP